MSLYAKRTSVVFVIGLASLALSLSRTATAADAVPSGPGKAQAGAALDPSFGDGGVVRLKPGSAFTTFGVAARGGKLLVSGGHDVRVLGESGHPAQAFGGFGSLQLPVPEGDRSEIDGMTVDPMGRLLVLETLLFPESENPSPFLEDGARAFRPGVVGLVRILPSGRLDPSFGQGGIVETDLGLPAPEGTDGQVLGEHPAIRPTGIALGTEGRIVVTGGAVVRLGRSCEHDSFAAVGVAAGFVARLTGNGEPDVTFGNLGLVGGRALSENALGAETISEPIVAPSGVITYRSTSAYACEPRRSRYGIGQLTPLGRARSAFGHEGALPGPYVALAGDSDGSVVALAELSRSGGEAYEAEVARIGPDGKPDSSFGRDGWTALTLAPSLFTHLNSLAIDPQGGVLVGGTLYAKKEAAAVLLRVSPHGKQEKSFGPHGRVVTRTPDLPITGPSSLFFDSRGRLVALHLHSEHGYAGLVVARYLLRDRS